MGYHTETLAFSFPPYASDKAGRLSKALYRLSPWIGFDIWHIDPEQPGTGNRRDDSCGWFPRNAGPYEQAVVDTLQDRDILQHIGNTIEREVFWRSAYLEEYLEPQRGWKRVTPADALALVLMVGSRLEHLRWWSAYRTSPWWWKPFVRRYDVTRLLVDLVLNPGDNLAPSSSEYPESFIRLTAAALHRHIRPWWRHPRWHVHHWQINVKLWRNLKRATIERCATCKKALGFGYCPSNPGDGTHHHSECLGHGSSMNRASSQIAD